MAEEWLKSDRTILATFRGSISHGTYIPSTDPDSIDDRDMIAVQVFPLDHYYGIARPMQRETVEIKDATPDPKIEDDVVIYELVHFVKMLRQCNPNVIAALWADPKHVIKRTGHGNMLWGIRRSFVSKALFAPFVGFAKSQFHRTTAFEPNGFKGKKRKELIDRHGYDTKNAQHLFRVLRMGVEALQTGEIWINREGRDAEELLAIKRGTWTLEKVKEEAAKLFEEAERALKASKLPDEPDHDTIDRVTRQILREFHEDELLASRA